MKRLLRSSLIKLGDIIFYSDNFTYRLLLLLSRVGMKKSYFTYHLRPKMLDKIVDDKIIVKNTKQNKLIGIVIQGPILYEDDFTLNTIKIYKKNFKNAQIILSIWDTENHEKLEKFYKEDIIVIKNKKPKNTGFINLNYQIVSTKSAIKKANELGCEYILKTRTDFRVYETGVGEFLINLLYQYPVSNKKQKFRIIGVDINTHKYGIGISDVFQFGKSEDMLKMWDIDLSKSDIKLEDYKKFEIKSNAIERYNYEFSECYLLKKFCEKIEFPLQPKLKSYYDVLKQSFIIIDAQMINLFWNKYLGDEYKEGNNYQKIIALSGLKYKDWLSIYHSDEIFVKEEILSKSYKFWKENTIQDL